MLSENEIERALKRCLFDRANYLNMIEHSLIRKCGFDLFVKYCILLFNSVGKQKKSQVLYVDEVNNPNARNNLQKTAKKVHGKEAVYLRFYSFDRSSHCRLGYVWPIKEAIRCFPIILISLFSAAFLREPMQVFPLRYLVKAIKRYIGRVEGIELFILMSDHQFFSTIFASEKCIESIVLQHGLIQDKRFYSPVYADRFFGWSKKSLQLLGTNRVVVTGTYKFEPQANSNKTIVFNSQMRLLVCFSSSKTSKDISKRLKPILALRDQYHFRLLLKMHPGSIFSLDSLAEFSKDDSVEIYKEEKIEDISFDFAFAEESTAVLDIASMGKPFILCEDTNGGYFSEYRGILPIALTPHEVIELFNSFDMQSFQEGCAVLLENEILSGRCLIADEIRSCGW